MEDIVLFLKKLSNKIIKRNMFFKIHLHIFDKKQMTKIMRVVIIHKKDIF